MLLKKPVKWAENAAQPNLERAVMLNPFVNLNSTVVELELKRRQRFKVGVYSFLMATLLFLMGLLIQGCRAEQKSVMGRGQERELPVPQEPVGRCARKLRALVND